MKTVNGSQTMTATELLASWGTALDLGEVPETVRDAACDHLLDTLGCGLAAHALGEATAGRAVALQAGLDGPATVLGLARGAPAPAAALANGMLCHALDFDDTHERSVCHVGAVIGPAVLAMAEAVGASGEQALAALVIGSEALIRIGSAASEGFHRRGFHPTSVCGVFGATLAVCRLRGAGAEETAQALGLAGSLASGILAYLGDGSPTKPLHAGWAAQAGIQASMLAAAGARGPRTVLEGRFGLYATHVDAQSDIEAQLGDLGQRWEVPSIAIKPYPACHWTHAAIDAAVEAVGEEPPGAIERITVRIPEGGIALVLDPIEAKRRPSSAYDAKFSLPWCIAARLVHGRLDLSSFSDELLDDGRVLALAQRIDYEPWAGEAPGSTFAGAVEASVGGALRSARREAPRGSAILPIGREDLIEKFTANARLALDDESIHAVIRGVAGIAHGGRVQDVTASLRAPAARAGKGRQGDREPPQQPNRVLSTPEPNQKESHAHAQQRI